MDTVHEAKVPDYKAVQQSQCMEMLTSAKLYDLDHPDSKSKHPSKNIANQKKSQRVSAYFDSALKELHGNLGRAGKVPKFNNEFLLRDQSNLKGTVRKGF